jgi:hypothetical protein
MAEGRPKGVAQGLVLTIAEGNRKAEITNPSPFRPIIPPLQGKPEGTEALSFKSRVWITFSVARTLITQDSNELIISDDFRNRRGAG